MMAAQMSPATASQAWAVAGSPRWSAAAALARALAWNREMDLETLKVASLGQEGLVDVVGGAEVARGAA
jgi:hypothetical protein